jgi:elongator complex protein 3
LSFKEEEPNSGKDTKKDTKILKSLSNQQKIECVSREIIKELILHADIEKSKVTQLKNRIMKGYFLKETIKNSEIMEYATEEELELILPILRRRATRSISGVLVAAVMTKPLSCPGHCIYCPGENSQPGEKAAKSYTGQEPAAKRSIIYNYDSYLQTKHRLMDQHAIGHRVDKVELICMGGTLLSAPDEYQQEFIKGCYDAINNFFVPNYNNDYRGDTLDEALKKAETTKLRIVGLTVETRPDYCTPEYVNKMLSYGTTRVEIGIQTTRESIMRQLKRGHTIDQSIDAIMYAKDAGLKVNAHMMPNLPGSTIEDDYLDFKTLFQNPDFRPDMIKIYPTLVIKGTELYEMWQRGEYKSYTLDDTVELIARIKSEIPPWVRIQRVQRDIPAYLIVDGVKKSNLRQLVQKHLIQTGRKCNCIRCREEGFAQLADKHHVTSEDNFGGEYAKRVIYDFNEAKLTKIVYEASKGTEIFISYETPTSLIGYLRLRKPSELTFRPELNDSKTTIVREIKVVGEMVPKDNKPTLSQVQHRGFGKKLIEEAERISYEDYDAKKISIISGIGVREYFYKQGYSLDGIYVSKQLK